VFWTSTSRISGRVARPRLHSDDAILDAALAEVLERGARAVTIDSIAQASGAPKGSLYHRFGSLNDLLAEMWIRAVHRAQDDFLAALEHPDPLKAALAAAASLYDFSAAHRSDARLLAAMRREDLVASELAPRLRRELEELNHPLERALSGLARRLFGRAMRSTIEATVCATSDIPLGAIRRHLVAGTPFPRGLRQQLIAAARAVLAQAGAPARDR
jgi:AcrR family transcriptional regulator